MAALIQDTFPGARALPHIDLGVFPTPVEPMERLGAELEIPHLYVKRDDRSGPHYGGNKVRKLEFILGDALEQGYEEVLTIGAIGSHHVLATCIYARELGLKPAAQHFPQPVTAHVLDNLRALSTTQPELELVGHPVELPFHLFKKKLGEWLSRRPETYYITGGGSSVLGVMGYVNAALELREQIEQGLLPEPELIFVAAGTNGTLAGLIVGCQLAGLSTRVVGVRVVDRAVTNQANVLRLANLAVERLRRVGVEAAMVGPRDFELLEGYFGPAYGQPTPAGARAIDLATRFEGLALDPTYTGKAFAGLLGQRRARELGTRSVLYWHTLNSVDLSDRIERADITRDLPEPYRVFFEEFGS